MALPDADVSPLLDDLSVLARHIIERGQIPLPNPMGLPRPEL